MKPIILDANEMTDSTEVYSSRPNPFFIIFIYLLLAILIIAIGWMCFSKIDIVVKAQGNVTTEDNLSTVTNTLAGNITDINVVDGHQVNEGDVLYSIEYDDLETQLNQQKESMLEIQDRITILKAYLEWLNGNDNALDKLTDNKFYSEYLAKKELIELNYDSVTESTDSKKSQYSTALNNTENSINYYEDEISKIEQLLAVIKDRSNSFAQDEVYYYSFVENYISEYTSTKEQYEDKISSLEVTILELKTQKSNYKDQIDELQNSIDTSKEKIEIATAKISELEQSLNTTTQENATQEIATQDNTTQETTTEKTTTQETETTTQDSIVLENQKLIEEQKKIITEETSNIETYNTKIAELKESISDINTNIDTAKSQIENYENEQENALYNLQMDNISSVEQKKKTLEETLANLEGNRNETKNNLNHISDDTDKLMTRSSEINNTYSDISSYEAREKEVQANIEQLENNIGETTLKASKSGVVNLLVDIEKGDYLSSGTEVMTIIPEDSSSYVVNLYISNADIGLLKEGMNVKYEIAAFPSSEYGNIIGTIQSISKDTKVSDSSGISYYKATATVDHDTFYNATGNMGTLKVGMACESKIITGQKSVLRYFLEKINLLD